MEEDTQSGGLPTWVPGAVCSWKKSYGHIIYTKVAAYTEKEFVSIFGRTPSQLSVSPFPHRAVRAQQEGRLVPPGIGQPTRVTASLLQEDESLSMGRVRAWRTKCCVAQLYTNLHKTPDPKLIFVVQQAPPATRSGDSAVRGTGYADLSARGWEVPVRLAEGWRPR